MNLQKWELIYSPSDKDKNRWLLKLKIGERELMALINTISGTIGRPFLLEKDEYDFGFYLYEAKEHEVAALRKSLEEECPGGKFTGLTRNEGLDQLIDKVVKGLNNAVSGADTSVKIPEPASAPEREPLSPLTNIPETPKAEEKIQPAQPLAVPSQPKIVYSGSDGNDGFLDLDLNKGYTFEEFVIGPNNRFTAAAAQAVADNPGKIYNPFFIYGGVGLGKTHMMHAVGHYVRRKTPNLKVLYVTTEKFMSEVIDSIRRGHLQFMRDHYRQVDLLLVDDVQFLVESESTQEEFFHTFNILHQSGKQIIITSDRPPKHLTTLEDRLRSRFEWGLIADIKSPNLETRVAILKKKGEMEKVKLDDNMLLYIASKLKSNIRELEGFLKRINAYATLTHQEVNMDLVHSLMADLLPQEEGEEAYPQQPPVQRTVPAQSPTPTPPPPPVAQMQQQPLPPPPPPEPPVQAPQAVQKQEPPAPPKEEEPIQIVFVPKAEARPPEPPKPVPPKPVVQQQRDPSESNLKSVDVAFFYPEAKDEELIKVKDHFRDVIKKHKLKFRLEGIFERPYMFLDKINYAFFAELCKTNGVGIAIVLGPPLDSATDSEEFANLLSTIMDDEKISLQLIPWAELNKDYRYLNLALDITLLRHKI